MSAAGLLLCDNAAGLSDCMCTCKMCNTSGAMRALLIRNLENLNLNPRKEIMLTAFRLFDFRDFIFDFIILVVFRYYFLVKSTAKN